MSFLAVTGFQAAVLALITAGAIVALYFLRLSSSPFVASLFVAGAARTKAHSLWKSFAV
jgi:hypothetical protein